MLVNAILHHMLLNWVFAHGTLYRNAAIISACRRLKQLQNGFEYDVLYQYYGKEILKFTFKLFVSMCRSEMKLRSERNLV